MGFDSVTIGFSKHSCTVKLVHEFSKVDKGMWLILRQERAAYCGSHTAKDVLISIN